MLSAHKEEKKLHVVSSRPNAATLAGFGKVLNSIQGLQQRLGDFSVDDVDKATENVRTLSLRLSQLQSKIRRLTEISESIAVVRTAVDRASNETSELIKLESFDKPLHLQAIVQASKLIRFPKVTKIGNATTKIPSLKTIGTEPKINLPSLEPRTAKPAAPHSNATEPSAPPKTEIEIESPSLVKKVVIQDLTVIAAPVQTSSGDDQQTQSEKIAPELLIEQPSVDSWQLSPTPEVEIYTPAFEMRNYEAPARQPLIQPLDEASSDKEGKALVPESSDFDQRLLDDLIKNYGEFAATPNLPAAIEPVESSTAKANKQEAQPAPKPRHEFIKTTLPSVKNEGELDRQLKKLIKDYGEYDLYSHQSPINLKTGVIAAFLLLGAVLSGFYFFSAPKAADPPQGSFTTQSTSDSSSGAGTPANVNGLSAEKAGPADFRKSAEAADAGLVPDKTSIKRKK
jgi:hypothetical protein